jgi:hypothetical protein
MEVDLVSVPARAPPPPPALASQPPAAPQPDPAAVLANATQKVTDLFHEALDGAASAANEQIDAVGRSHVANLFYYYKARIVALALLCVICVTGSMVLYRLARRALGFSGPRAAERAQRSAWSRVKKTY